MWLWGTIFGLGRDLPRFAMRGLGCIFALGFIVALLGGLGSSLIAYDHDNAGALAVGALSVDPDASVGENARQAARGYRDTREWLRPESRRAARSNDVAADWERARREQESEDAVRSAYAYDY